MLCFHGNHPLLVLQLAINQQELLLDHRGIIFLKQLRRDDRISDACFIFKAEKNKTFRCSRPLPGNNRAGDPNGRSISQTVKVGSRSDTLFS